MDTESVIKISVGLGDTESVIIYCSYYDKKNLQ